MVGYARVSMDDQSNQRQIDEIVKFGVDPRDIFTDMASGRDMKRPGWAACWKDLRGPEGDNPHGDLLVVHAIDRLGRDMLQVCQTLKALHEKGCALKVLSMDIDTRTPVGYFTFSIMAAFAEMERKLILERTMHGLAKARERGVIGGTVAKYSHQEILDAAEKFGVNQGGANLPRKPMSKGGFIKALKRARDWQLEKGVTDGK